MPGPGAMLMGEEEKKELSKTQHDTDHNTSADKSLNEYLAKLAESYDRLSKVEEKRAYDQDPSLGISPIVYPKSDKNPKRDKKSK